MSWFSVIITPIGESTFLIHEFTEADLQRLLDQFIEKYALCSHCLQLSLLIYATHDGKLIASCTRRKCSMEKSLDLKDEVYEIYFNYCTIETPLPIRKPSPDSINIPAPSPKLNLKDPRIEQAIDQIDSLVGGGSQNYDIDNVLSELYQIQLQLDIDSEVKIYILLCGLFSRKRDILAHWATHEQLFGKLLQRDRNIDSQHLFLAIIAFFTNK